MASRRDIERLRGEIDELFADLWQIPRFAGLRRGFRPPVDCFRGDDPPTLTVFVDLAGIDPEEVQVVVSGRVLVVSGERHRPPCEGRYEQMEIDYGPFQREIRLTDDVDTPRASASYDRGVLIVELPLAQRPRTQGTVPVTVKRGS